MIRRIALLLAVLTSVPSDARADGPKRPPHRTVPDYDGREPPPPTTVDVLAWVPRIVLFPARLVVDYGVVRPLGWTVRRAEHSSTLRKVLRRLFREVEDANPLIYPVALVDFGFKSSIGARIVWRRGIAIPRSDLTLRAGTGGLDWWRLDVNTKTRLGAMRVRTNVGANRRPDYLFYGLGPYTTPAARSRYSLRIASATASVGGALEDVGEVLVFGGLTDTDFRASRYGGDRSIDEQVAAGVFDQFPVTYATGYRTLRLGGRITLDTRFEDRRARSGARLDVMAERVTDLDRAAEWTRVELMAGAGLLLDSAAERKLDVRLGIQFVRSDDKMEVPFVELPGLTGLGWLRGIPGGRIHGITAAALICDYDWPIAAWLDAHAHVGVGNVYGPALSGFSLASLRGSVGGALTIAGLTDRQVGMSVAYGTEPLGDGIDFTSSRIILEYSGDY